MKVFDIPIGVILFFYRLTTFIKKNYKKVSEQINRLLKVIN